MAGNCCQKTNIHNIVKFARKSTYSTYIACNYIVRLATTSIKQMGQLDKYVGLILCICYPFF